jgi:tetratricopeptide (TPR) repeat protein
MVMHLKFLIPAALAAAMLSACATTALNEPVLGKKAITAEMVLETSPLVTGTGAEDFTEADVLALSPDMVEFLDENVDRDENQYQQLRQLVYAVIGDGQFDLEYDGSTLTAEETFHSRHGNCLSFTNMFVAMARRLGLRARYQEVEIPPNWSLAGQTFLISEHVNALVDFKNEDDRIVDFNFYGSETVYEMHVISDQRAFAHYYNNIGVEYMLADDTRSAYANFRKSIRTDPTFSSVWVNLGNLHRRGGFPGYAEVAYLEALEIDRNNHMAMSNLANLYEQVGKSGLAETYRSRVRRHRMANPYYRYQVANIAFNEGDYKAAIQNLKYAIHHRDDEDRFYFLLSLSYLMSGDKEEAQKWMKKAEEVARDTAAKKKYQHKMDLLQGMGRG